MLIIAFTIYQPFKKKVSRHLFYRSFSQKKEQSGAPVGFLGLTRFTSSSFLSIKLLLRNRLNNCFSLLLNHLGIYPTAGSLNYFWSFGSAAGIFLSIQIVTGIVLVIHYKVSVTDSFNSIEHMMRDLPYGWLFRYMHSNGATFFFLLLYLHMGRGLYYGSYAFPRSAVWVSGVLIYILAIATAFIGYVLPWGQISFWGATVITNIVSSLPFIGQKLVIWLWGGFSVGDATLNRFFSLHYLLPFILLILVVVHLFVLHYFSSNKPLGVSVLPQLVSETFYDYFYLKDMFGFLCFFILYFYVVFFIPNFFGHPDNYIEANPLVTPSHIVPEWYFLPFYAILRSIPNKLGGVCLIFGGLVLMLCYPFVHNRLQQLPNLYGVRTLEYTPVSRFLYWLFIVNFCFLGFIGGCPVEAPFYVIGQLSTFIFFVYWIFAPIIISFEIFLYQNLIQNSVKEVKL